MTLSHVEAQFLSLGHGLLKFTQHQFGSIWILGGRGPIRSVSVFSKRRRKFITCNITYHSVACFEDFRGTAVRQVSSITVKSPLHIK